jgi:hypothetical protein
MKAVLFKYGADPRDPLLRDDKGGYGWCSLRDPDFWTNRFPVWGVCGPYVRNSLQPGDIVFFVPQLNRIKKANLSHADYIFTGILVVSDLISESREVMKDNRLTETYKRYYLRDLRDHLNKIDKGNRTSEVRVRNFVVGTSTKQSRLRSVWLGKKGPVAKDLVKKYGLTESDLRKRRIPYVFGRDKAERLYSEIMRNYG